MRTETGEPARPHWVVLGSVSVHKGDCVGERVVPRNHVTEVCASLTSSQRACGVWEACLWLMVEHNGGVEQLSADWLQVGCDTRHDDLQPLRLVAHWP